MNDYSEVVSLLLSAGADVNNESKVVHPSMAAMSGRE